MDEIVEEFLIESHENLDRLDTELVVLEERPDDREVLASIFRTIHTIKGTCGFLGFSKLEAVTHAGENLLSLLRDGALRLTPEITNALLAMVDAVREILGHIERTGAEGDGDYGALTERLTRLQEGAASEASPAEVAADEGDGGPRDRLGEILLESGQATTRDLAQALVAQMEGDSRLLGELLVEQGAVSPEAVNEALERQSEVRGSALSENNIRVDVHLLDKLMNLVGELVLARNQILQYTGAHDEAALVATSQRLNLITTELQEGVMKTRMQPIGNIWNKFPRVVRDLAVACGKQVRIEMEGKETELDRTIVEAIKDPLTHIVRNSVDHGIEPPEERIRRGKSAEGVLSLRAHHEGGQVNIEISDDGAGIDAERVKERAIARGLVTAERAERMSERDLLNLIFLPGFSTARQITNISGRGVGMDVVRNNIERIGGSVDIQSRPGRGTTIRMKIPLTLAIIPALVVTSGGERFAIPQVNLVELVRVDGDGAGVESVHGAPVYRLRGHLLPLVYLNRALALEDGAAAGREGLRIVVLQADDRQFGLVVDEVNDTQEIVVKPMGHQLKGLACFAGATIMGDGKVALILDVLGIAQQAGVVTSVRGRALVDADRHAAEAGADRRAFLLFGLGDERRMAIPLSAVSRLEEIPRSSVEKASGRDVVQYRGRILPLIHVADHVGGGFGAAAEPDDTLQVIVYAEGDRSVGLVVGTIEDVVEDTVAVERRGFGGAVLGSAVIQGRVTDLIDVQGLIESADPTFFADMAA